MSDGNITSGFVPVGAPVDNLQDYEGFQYCVAEGSPSNLGPATATNPANAVQIVNCSPCPLKVTYTMQPIAGKGEEAGEPITKEIVYKPGEANTVKFGQGVITEVLVEEAVAAPKDALTPDAGSGVNAAASADLVANIRFLNC